MTSTAVQPPFPLGSAPILWVAPLGFMFPSSFEHQQNIHHSAAGGGVLAESWSFASNSFSVRPFHSDSAQGRQIKHLINPRLYFGRRQLSDDGEAFRPAIEDTQRLTLSSLDAEVRCRAIFSPSGYTVRRLSVRELMGVFDLSHSQLPESVDGDQEILPTIQSERYHFVSTPPVNVVLQILSHW